ncbi:hypothetical protein C6501_01280, partial [Candidatus Poribacteria bacterium]
MNLLFDIPKTEQRKEKISSWAKRYIDIAQDSDNFTREKKLLKLKESKPKHLTKKQLELLVR